MASKELTVVQRAAVALNSGENKKALAELVAQSKSIVEIKNAAAREQCHSAAMSLRTRRTDIRKVGKEARDDATKFSKAVIAEEDSLVAIIEPEEQRLLKLRDAWDEEREAEKKARAEAEARRVSAIRDAIEEFRRAPGTVPATSSEMLDEHADDLARAPITIEAYMEFTGEAEAARDVAVAALREMAEKARRREADEARVKAELLELARLRAEHEERERAAAAARAEQEAKDRAAREAEEGRLRAEREAEERKIRAAREAHEAEMQAQREELARQQAELEAERRRQAEEAEAKRQHEEALAQAEAERERIKQEKKLAEKKKREQEDFLVQGPGAAAMIDVLATHYAVEQKTILHWMFLYQWPQVEVSA